MKALLPMRVWFQTWPERGFWWDVPALLACMACIGFAFVLRQWSPAAVRGHYSGVVREALAGRDYETARVGCQRLLALGSESRARTLFELAMALQGLNRKEEASAIVSTVAPYDKAVYAPAHLYVARCLMTGTNLTAETTRNILVQLNHVVALEPDSLEANDILGRYYFQRKDWKMAKKYLSPIVYSKPEFMFWLASSAKELGDERGARDWRERALRHYKDKVEKANLDNAKDRLLLAQALMLQDRYPEAIRIVEAGAEESGNDDYRFAIADIYATWAVKTATEEPSNLTSRIKLIQQGLECAPQHPQLLRMLLDVSDAKGLESKSANEQFLTMLAAGGSSGILHFILGIDAWSQGDAGLARKHFNLAFELAPSMPAVANNTAMLLLSGDKQDLPRALAIIEAVLEKFPEEPNLRKTRGHALLKSHRWSEAIKDLEFALPRLQDKQDIHKALAEAYEALGMKESAADHRRMESEKTSQ